MITAVTRHNVIIGCEGALLLDFLVCLPTIQYTVVRTANVCRFRKDDQFEIQFVLQSGNGPGIRPIARGTNIILEFFQGIDLLHVTKFAAQQFAVQPIFIL